MSNATDPRSCGQVTAVAVHPTLGNGGLVFVETDSHRLTARLVERAVSRVGDTLRLLVLGSVLVTDLHGNSRAFELDLVRASLASEADRAERLQRIGRKTDQPYIVLTFWAQLAVLLAIASGTLTFALVDMLVALARGATNPSIPAVQGFLILVLVLCVHLGACGIAMRSALNAFREHREVNFDFWIGLQRKEKPVEHCPEKPD